MAEKIKLVISACLLGEKVRHDSGHKLDPFLRDILGKWVQYVSVCPEVECSLPTPREAMRLVGDPENPRLVTNNAGIDYTEKMKAWGAERLKELEKEDLCGFILKSRSPSCGIKRIKVYSVRGKPVKKGVGLWARMFMDHFPLFPVEDESRLHGPMLRENFIERVFVFKRWRETVAQGKTLGSLVEFHTRHKLLIMSHSIEAYRKLGKLVAEGKKHAPEQLYREYLNLLAGALKLEATLKKNINVLYHLMGFFKKALTADERRGVPELIDSYAKGYVPLIVPVTMFNHFVRKYHQPYLKEQYYLNPHPLELKLRTHV